MRESGLDRGRGGGGSLPTDIRQNPFPDLHTCRVLLSASSVRASSREKHARFRRTGGRETALGIYCFAIDAFPRMYSRRIETQRKTFFPWKNFPGTLFKLFKKTIKFYFLFPDSTVDAAIFLLPKKEGRRLYRESARDFPEPKKLRKECPPLRCEFSGETRFTSFLDPFRNRTERIGALCERPERHVHGFLATESPHTRILNPERNAVSQVTHPGPPLAPRSKHIRKSPKNDDRNIPLVPSTPPIPPFAASNAVHII